MTRRLGADDRRYAYRVLRAWLHVVRDRLTVDSAAHLGAQLPELLRGLFYEGWSPSRVPVRYDNAEFTERYAAEAGIAPADVPAAAAAVTAALRDLFSPGQLDHALAQLPRPLRALLTTGIDGTPAGDGHGPTSRLVRLEHTVALLAEAVRELAHGLEASPLDEPDDARAANAARAVHQLLLTSEPTR